MFDHLVTTPATLRLDIFTLILRAFRAVR